MHQESFPAWLRHRKRRLSQQPRSQPSQLHPSIQLSTKPIHQESGYCHQGPRCFHYFHWSLQSEITLPLTTVATSLSPLVIHLVSRAFEIQDYLNDSKSPLPSNEVQTICYWYIWKAPLSSSPSATNRPYYPTLSVLRISLLSTGVGR